MPDLQKKKTERKIPLYSMERVFKELEDIRVSEDAKEELKKYLEEYAKKISVNAVEFSKHAKRRTITKADVDLALEKI